MHSPRDQIEGITVNRNVVGHIVASCQCRRLLYPSQTGNYSTSRLAETALRLAARNTVEIRKGYLDVHHGTKPSELCTKQKMQYPSKRQAQT